MDIKALREKHNINQADAAELGRVSARQLQRYENGQQKCPESVYELIALKLGEKAEPVKLTTAQEKKINDIRLTLANTLWIGLEGGEVQDSGKSISVTFKKV